MKSPNSKWTLLSLATAVPAALMVLASTLGAGRMSEAQPARPTAGKRKVLAPT